MADEICIGGSCPDCGAAGGEDHADFCISNQAAVKPLLGRWRHSEGLICCGTMRIAKVDFDTDPSQDFQEELLDWICKTLNEAK